MYFFPALLSEHTDEDVVPPPASKTEFSGFSFCSKPLLDGAVPLPLVFFAKLQVRLSKFDELQQYEKMHHRYRTILLDPQERGLCILLYEEDRIRVLVSGPMAMTIIIRRLLFGT